MITRKATLDDLSTVLGHADAFHQYGVWKDVPVDWEAFGAFATAIIDKGAIFLADDGMCGGCLSPLYFNPAFTLAVEFFWWSPKNGQALRSAFEQWALEQGANAIQFSAMGDDHAPAIARLYRRAGYVPAETAYIKRVA